MHDTILSAHPTHPLTPIGRYNRSNKSDSILDRTAQWYRYAYCSSESAYTTCLEY